jgi:hypothetical protein
MIGATEIVGKTCEVRLSLGDPVERQADPEPVAVLADCGAGELGEHAAKAVRGAANDVAEALAWRAIRA